MIFLTNGPILFVILALVGSAMGGVAAPREEALTPARSVGSFPAAFAPIVQAALNAAGAEPDLGPILTAHRGALRSVGVPVGDDPNALDIANTLRSEARELAGLGPRERIERALALHSGSTSPRGLSAWLPPGVALSALAEAAGSPLTLDERLDLAALDGIAPEAAASIGRLAVAALDQLRAASASAHDPAGLARARDAALLAAFDEAVALRALGPQPFSAVACGVYDIDLDGSFSTHACDAILSIDLVGNDLYTNNAGGGASLPVGQQPTAAILVDTDGSDAYASGDVGAIGAGAGGGIGILVDLVGNDSYAAQIDGLAGGAAIGSGQLGAGALVDLAGRDSYHAVLRVQGAAIGSGLGGSGFLFDDGSEDDDYQADVPSPWTLNSASLIGSGRLGTGTLIEGGGNDTYTGDFGYANFYGWDAHAAINGGGSYGVGLLADLGGDDRYHAYTRGGGAVNGGGHIGMGTLVDLGGQDAYDALVSFSGGANGGAANGLGILIDAGSESNNFNATGPWFGGSNGAAAGSTVGTRVRDAMCGPGLLDDRSNPCSTARPCGTVGGFLGVPQTGGPFSTISNTLHSTSMPCHDEFMNHYYAYVPAVGILLAGSGDDHYRGDNVTQGAGDLAGLGILVDRGGRNTFEAGPGSGPGLPDALALAQGAGRDLGVGILLDRGDNSTYRLLSRTAGQGAGLLGVGILLHDVPGSVALYSAPSDAFPLYLDGNGIGFRTDLGTSVLDETIRLGCAEDTEKAVEVSDKILVCWPSESQARPVQNVLTRRPVPDTPKPVCTLTNTTGHCAVLNGTDVFTPSQERWLASSNVTSKLSGGLLHYEDAGLNVFFTRYDMAMYDDGCGFVCADLRNLT